MTADVMPAAKRATRGAASPTQRRAGKPGQFDRSVEDLGNVIALEHVNVLVPDQGLATLFYVSGLGLTRDPYLMTSIDNMWINVGRSQFHLPTGPAQVLRGHTALVIPDRQALLQRLARVESQLEGTRFAFAARDGFVEATCPWGNRLRCFEPGPAWPGMMLGMPYVQLDVPAGSAGAIAAFCNQVLGTPASVRREDGEPAACVSVGPGQELRYRETKDPIPDYDGHHIAIYVADFSGPHRRLSTRGLVSEESDQHQYRFVDLVDLTTGKPLFALEHEVRSMRHPLYARPLVNRNPAQTNRSYAPGYDAVGWALSDPAA
jgi:hypothetical protein